MRRLTLTLFAIAGCFVGLPVCVAADPGKTPTLDEILKSVRDADSARRDDFRGYTSLRSYVVENKRFHLQATMTVRTTVGPAGAKTFEIVAIKAPAALRKMVFDRMLATEKKASDPSIQASTRINEDNYRFRFVEAVPLDGRLHYLLEAEPKSDSPLLFRGRVWIDPDSWAIAQIEGSPSQNPSFWVNKTSFTHRYQPIGGQWLANNNLSQTDVRVFGPTVVRVEYSDYQLAPKPEKP